MENGSLLKAETPAQLTEEIIREAIKRSPTNGVYFFDIPNKDYHAGPGLSSSEVKTIYNKTIAKYLYDKKNRRQETPALRLGTSIHMKLLEPQAYIETYCLDKPAIPARNKIEGKAVYKEWLEKFPERLAELKTGKLDTAQWEQEYLAWKHPGQLFVSQADQEVINGISDNVEAHDQIQKMFKGGVPEVSFYWIDKETDILCKCRPDIWNDELKYLVDPKSCADASLDAFEGDITTRDYNVSAAWYLWGVNEVLGRSMDGFIYVPCEKEPPYQVTYYLADEGSLAAGEGLYRAALIMLKRHIDNNDLWTGHSKVAKTVGVRPWAFNKISQVIAKHDLHGMGLEKYTN